MRIITLVLISVLGGIYIYLQDPLYIKFKISALAWLFAIVFISSQYIGDKNIIEGVMGKIISAPKHIWKQLNIVWVSFFILVGTINLYIIYNFDTGTWITFKTFGVAGMSIVFFIIQSVFMAKYLAHDSSNEKTTNGRD